MQEHREVDEEHAWTSGLIHTGCVAVRLGAHHHRRGSCMGRPVQGVPYREWVMAQSERWDGPYRM